MRVFYRGFVLPLLGMLTVLAGVQLVLLAQGAHPLTITLTDKGLKGLTNASALVNAACLQADPKATCNESPDEYAQRIFSAVAEDYYTQLVGGFNAEVVEELKKAQQTGDDAKLDAVASALGVVRPEKIK